jgi:hypothetical protein
MREIGGTSEASQLRWSPHLSTSRFLVCLARRASRCMTRRKAIFTTLPVAYVEYGACEEQRRTR